MRRVLLCNDRSLRVIRLPGEGGVFSFIDCNSADDARRYLQDYAHDPSSLTQMRTILAEDAHGIDVWRLDDWEVMDEVAARVSLNRLTIAEELDEPLPPIPQPEETSAPVAPPPELPRTKKLTWIEIQMVWDATGEAVKNVRLVITAPDGESNYHDTDAQGVVRVDEIEPGTCDVYCELKNATVSDTLGFVGKGEAKPKNGEQPSTTTASTLRIAQVQEKTVADGETIDSIASGAGMTSKALSTFNWETEGGTVETGDKLLVPKKWEESGLACGQRHIFRIKPLTIDGAQVGPAIEVHEEAPVEEEAPPPAEAPADDEVIDDGPPDDDSTVVAEEAPPEEETEPATETAGAGGGGAGGGGAKPAGAVVKGAPAFVVVSKPWMKIPRKAMTLKTDSKFDGTGTLTIAGTSIKFFDAAKDGNEITGTAGNTFEGKKLASSGVKIYAEGASASAAIDDVTLTLTLTGGTKAVKPPAEVKLTAIDVVLDICGERTTPGPDPDPMDQPPDTAPGKDEVATDKFYGGRFIQVQDTGKNSGRALLIVRQVKPAGFTGTLVLRSVSSKVNIFAKEDPKDAGAAIKLPKKLKAADFAAGDVQFWVQGASNSGGLRDSGFILDVKDVVTGADQVKITVVKFFKIKATIKSTPANTVRPGVAAPADHTFETNKLTDDFADAKNKPLVMMRNGQPDIALEVTVKPKGLPILWQAIRNPSDDISLGDATKVPNLTQDANNANKCTLACDNMGSFRIRPYIDTNGDGNYNEKEPSMPLNLVLANATLVADNSAGITGNLTSSLAGYVDISNGTWPATWAAATGAGGAGMTMELVADVTGGGADGLLGLNKVFGGLTNMLEGNEITLTYQSQVAPITTHTVRNRYVLNRVAATGRYGSSPPDPKDLFQPGHTAPILLAFPVLDTGRDPGGLGAETAVMGRSGIWDPLPTPQAVGTRYTLRCIDSPGRGFLLQHPNHATEYLVTIHYVQRFRANFCFWTNVNNTRAKSGHAAERVYSVLRHMLWEAVGDWTVTWAPAGTGFAGTLTNTNPHAINVTAPTTVTPIGRAQDNGVEVRPPSGITKAIAWETD